MNKSNCYECKYRAEIPGDTHSECKHPTITPGDGILSIVNTMQGVCSNAMKRLNISASDQGIRNGWFYWPLNFDPVWLETCEGFEPKGGEPSEAKSEQSSHSDSQVESVSQSVLQSDERNERPIT